MTYLHFWHGVFNRKDELESVCESETLAEAEGLQLSAPAKQTTRTVRPVIIITIPLDDFVLDILEKAKLTQPGWPRARPQKRTAETKPKK